ncbi:hypothetical protein [Haliscomenobacter sp.]|uniref:hypothetical protein n=1 Tax=Haliscomenobacter sp. TaxID=2717303 RepID=UPI00336505E6
MRFFYLVQKKCTTDKRIAYLQCMMDIAGKEILDAVGILLLSPSSVSPLKKRSRKMKKKLKNHKKA